MHSGHLQFEAGLPTRVGFWQAAEKSRGAGEHTVAEVENIEGEWKRLLIFVSVHGYVPVRLRNR